ncbi:MFS transporter [Chryseobacterium camelliae]|uniref:MFS transporter n=1 Tax=Chryseobacterium camelliae TaxID=1265445 RepID=A0ABY7QLZ6_9FLAO|nr:MFS transporter [Chryseobacterium camelliae]WBV60679.1 MFS transporter [Chryseobacterium camelliae]
MNNLEKAGIFLSRLSVFAQLYLFQALLPLVSEYFNTGAGNSSLLISSSTIGMAIGLFFFAFKADAYPRKRLMTFSLLTSALLTIVSVWISNLSILIAFGFFKGFVISGVSAVALAYFSQNIYLLILGLAIFTLCFFSAHTMDSQLVALRAKSGKSSATSLYWLFYYSGSSILGSGTGYLLHATSWNFFVSLLIFILFIVFILSRKLPFIF